MTKAVKQVLITEITIDNGDIFRITGDLSSEKSKIDPDCYEFNVIHIWCKQNGLEIFCLFSWSHCIHEAFKVIFDYDKETSK